MTELLIKGSNWVTLLICKIKHCLILEDPLAGLKFCIAALCSHPLAPSLPCRNTTIAPWPAHGWLEPI